MGLDGLLADAEALGDLQIGAAVGHEAEHLALALRQALQRGGSGVLARGGLTHAAQQTRGDARMQHGLAARGAAHGVGQRVGIGVLEQIGKGAGLDGVDDLLLVLEAGQDHHLRGGAGGAHRARGLHAAAGHDQVDQGDVGAEARAQRGHAVGAVGLADDGQIGAGFQEGADALAHQHVVVGDDDAYDGGGVHAGLSL